MEQSQTKKIKFICLECDKVFNRAQRLEDHQNKTSCGIVCTQCNHKFPTRRRLEKHTCNNIQVKESNTANCTICKYKKEEQLFKDQWYEDRDGYSRCSTCGVKSDDELPKHCSCNAYIDIDGVEKCKSCNHLWGKKNMEFEQCDNCGFEGK